MCSRTRGASKQCASPTVDEDESPQADVLGNGFRAKLVDGLDAEPLPEGGARLTADWYDGTIPPDEWNRGLSGEFSSLASRLVGAGVELLDATDAAKRAHQGVQARAPEAFALDATEVVDRLDTVDAAAADGAAASADLDTFWWARDADEASSALGELTDAVRRDVPPIGIDLALPGSGVRFDASRPASVHAAYRRDQLDPLVRSAREIIAGAGDQLVDPSDHAARKAFQEQYFAPLSETSEKQYLLDAAGDTLAHPAVLARLAASMGLPLPAAVLAAFPEESQADVAAAWAGEGVRAPEGHDAAEYGTQLVVDLLEWDDRAGEEKLRVGDLERFAAFVAQLAHPMGARFQVPDLGAGGLGYALVTVKDFYEAISGDALPRPTERDAASGALSAVLDTWADVEGAGPALSEIRDQREAIESITLERTADAMITSLAGSGDDLESANEQVTFTALKTSAENALKARQEIIAKLAEITGGALSPSDHHGEFLVDPGEDVSSPGAGGALELGKAGLSIVSAMAEARSYAELQEALAGKAPDDDASQARLAHGYLKVAKAGAEVVCTFTKGFLDVTAASMARSSPKVAQQLLAFSGEFGKVAGQIFALVGLGSALCDFMVAVRFGGQDDIVMAGAGVANAAIGTAQTFGVIGASAGSFLNILVFEAVAIYEICKGLPGIAAALHRLDIAKDSQIVVEGTRDGLGALRRTQGASRAWEMTVFQDPELAEVLEARMGSNLRAAYDALAIAGIRAVNAPGIGEAFSDHLGFDDILAMKPPDDLGGKNLPAYLTRFAEFAKHFRHGVEDLTDETLLELGEIGPYEHVIRGAQRTAERTQEEEAAH